MTAVAAEAEELEPIDVVAQTFVGLEILPDGSVEPTNGAQTVWMDGVTFAAGG